MYQGATEITYPNKERTIEMDTGTNLNKKTENSEAIQKHYYANQIIEAVKNFTNNNDIGVILKAINDACYAVDECREDAEKANVYLIFINLLSDLTILYQCYHDYKEYDKA